MKKENDPNKPTAFEWSVLNDARAYYGEVSWRRYIQDAWQSGNYMGFERKAELQLIRNDPNRKWDIMKVNMH